MKTNLRRAHAIRVALESFVKDVTISGKSEISIFDVGSAENFEGGFQAVLKSREAALEEKVSQALWVTDALGRLRRAIASANEKAGLNGIISDIANIDAKVKILSDVYGRRAIDINAIKEEVARDYRTLEDLGRIRSASAGQAQTGYRGLSTSVSVDIRGEHMSERREQQIELRRKRSELENQRLSLNYSTHIEIPDDDIHRLEAMGII